MSAQIKEAIAAWKAARSYLELLEEEEGCDDEFEDEEPQERARQREVITGALEAAQQEAEAWELIEASHVKLGVTYSIGSYRVDSSKKLITLMQAGKEVFRYLGLDRLEALTKAAAWCRAEMAK